ncbi:hypothetical protein [Oceanispirochaeta sp.]|jgi:hypothetical protein|uniref:LVIVD repeat-containing protein n=1 Tax=Oceanispirochaeta sp. TaxID=2035350 RepID=UPI0026372F10|nr:hypothetical protein [Oceanispirochaeta sp.]MDA3956403.1 hypothetical protein [Oceanispirochaeta sp.]
MKKIVMNIFYMGIVSIVVFFNISCEPISLKTTIDDMVLGWSHEVTLTTPADGVGIAEKTPLLEWEDAGGATGYELQISDSESFDGVSTININEAVSQYEIPDELTICDIKYWRVRAVKDGEASEVWSETRSFEIEVSQTPKLVGQLNTGGSGFESVIDGDYAYNANGFAGLQIINISDPTNPVLTATIFGGVNEEVSKPVAKRGQYILFEEKGNPGPPNKLVIYDVSDPANPTLKGDCDVVYGGENYTTISIVVWTENEALLLVENKEDTPTEAPYGIMRADLYDLNSPSNKAGSMVEITGGLPWSLQAEGTTAVISVNDTGLLVYDILSHNFVGEYSIPDQLYGNVAINDGTAFVTSKNGPLQIIDISNTTSPSLVSTYAPDNGTTGGVSIFGHYAFVVKEQGYVMYIVDIKDLSNLELITTFDTFILAPQNNYGCAQNTITGMFNIVDLVPED